MNLEKGKKALKVLAAPIALTVFLVGCSGTTTTDTTNKGTINKSEIVATVGDVEITRAEFGDFLIAQYGPKAIDTLIAEKIIELEAEKQKVKVTQEEVDTEYQSYAADFGGEESLENMLEAYDVNPETLKSDIKRFLLTMKVMEKELGIKEQDIKEYFEKNKKAFSQQEEVKASHILVEDEKLAKDIIKKLDKGEDFAELAKEHSIDGTKDKGGDLGYFGKGVMVEEFEKAAFSMKVGEYSKKPVKSQFGYHIIKVTDKQESKDAKFEDVKAEVKDALLREKAEKELDDWLLEKREEYKVKNYLLNQDTEEKTTEENKEVKEDTEDTEETVTEETESEEKSDEKETDKKEEK